MRQLQPRGRGTGPGQDHGFKAITRLELRMRASLFHRTTRKLSLTETGRQSLERAARLLADGTAIETDIIEEAESPRGLVRLATISAVGAEAIAPIMPEFLAAYPDIEIDLVLTENRVDVVAEALTRRSRWGSPQAMRVRCARCGCRRCGARWWGRPR
jgi:DNA-binding transcriptional LysR family regulator